ncbi:hypothetical protein [Sphingobacterium griseoflavum]|uniref:Uncharacterized protein n=1 Tax=Sphingobacterium griseoflavum TaxID=1474952 RepID=A0ABQ3HTQ0_9SPHI|nr:hypothetical protein [Sphingobacterium griseoflavum]GHE23609.1 hypothetical protein GCM10017764_05770 [Sphingobacterium griseoflavum]
MGYYWALIKHFITANSRHGTHSPFVYRLAEQVVYAKKTSGVAAVAMPRHFPWGYRLLLQQILPFCGVSGLGTLHEGEDSAAIWVDLDDVSAERILHLVERGKILIVHEPHKREAIWDTLTANELVVVSIDLFHFGMLMHRDGQRKDHFILRYPYWKKNGSKRLANT